MRPAIYTPEHYAAVKARAKVECENDSALTILGIGAIAMFVTLLIVQ